MIGKHDIHLPAVPANREPTALAAGVEATVVATTRPEARTYGARSKHGFAVHPAGE